MGRPDDGTDVSTFNNAEFLADLKPSGQWRPQFHGNKEELIAAIQNDFKRFPGIDFNFSQNIQDNVEEAMSGVKGENSLKLFGNDFEELTRIADQIEGIMHEVPGITDVGVFDVTGQPSLMVSIDRTRAARYRAAAAGREQHRPGGGGRGAGDDRSSTATGGSTSPFGTRRSSATLRRRSVRS